MDKTNCNNEHIRGLISASFTPFNKDLTVNYSAIEPYCQMMVKNEIVGVFINGSSGEGQQLTDEERLKIAEEWVRVAPQGFKVIVHVGSNSTQTAKKFARHAQEIGAWGIGSMAQTFPRPNRIEELVAYCKELANAAPDLPFYYYHIPALTGVHLSPLELLKAVDGKVDNFAGLKFTHENLWEYNRCKRYKEGKFDALYGQDEHLLAAVAQSDAIGGIGGTYNYIASLYAGIHHKFRSGDLDTARKLQEKSQDIIEILVKYRGNMIAGKQMMKLIGLDLGGNRLPYQEMTSEEYDNMAKELENIGFFEVCNKIEHNYANN